MTYSINSQSNVENVLVKRSFFDMGGLWTCGYNGQGSLGDNTTTHKSSPVQTIAAGSTWKQIASSKGRHVAAVKGDGSLWGWGHNSYGQLGDNTPTHRSSPVQTVTGGTNWKQVAGGTNHTAAIKTDGTLWTWGYNTYGQLGDSTVTLRSSPVQTVTGGTNWKQVAGGGNHTVAIKADGTLWLWGDNNFGQLGDDTVANKSSPIQTVAGGTDWKSVACGANFTVALKTDGTLWVWGDNPFGQLGDNTTIKRSSPIQTIAGGTNWKQISCGLQTIAAIKTDGTLWMWGNNLYGRLGDNTSTHRSSPVQTIAGGTNWKSAACGYSHTGAIKTDGTLWMWGQNNYGQLRQNNTTNQSSPVQTVTGGSNWKAVACGYNSNLTIR